MTVPPVPPAQPEPPLAPATPSMRSAPETLPNGPAATAFPGQYSNSGQAPAPHWVQQGPLAPMRKSRKPLFFGLGGLGIGVAIGLLLGALGSAVGGAISQFNAIPDAVETCSAADTVGVDVMDEGKSLNLQTTGEESTGTSLATVVCVLTDLDAPESIFNKLEATRALDGTQSSEWPGFAASWTYHPDNGLNIIVETAAN